MSRPPTWWTSVSRLARRFSPRLHESRRAPLLRLPRWPSPQSNPGSNRASSLSLPAAPFAAPDEGTMRQKYRPRPLSALAAAFLLAVAQLATAPDSRGQGAANRADQRRSEAATPRTPLPPEAVTAHNIDIGGQKPPLTPPPPAARPPAAGGGPPPRATPPPAPPRAPAGRAAPPAP